MIIRKSIRTYQELISFPTFDERVDYLMLSGRVSDETFGAARYLNQEFYRSKIWKDCRRRIIIRDNACDLAHEDHPINGMVIVHHLNPITIDDLEHGEKCIIDPNNLVCISDATHRAITYGCKDLIPKGWTPRFKNDTAPWLL